ncbi:MAG: circularly permuted type 2 ATP-grasp protein [Granulosicoccus sp.]|nr:circularly permuted type 2 ATP-grasp protein [Granulosicoccus sp.]
MAFSRWHEYYSPCHDELLSENGSPHQAAAELVAWLDTLDDQSLTQRRQAAELAIRQMGITFTVYSDKGNIDREWPFDIIPRIIDATEWLQVERGLIQRVKALNCFIHDLYNQQSILDDGVVPRELIETSANFRPECLGMQPAHNVWAHICGSDLVRDSDGTMYVLEDNLRVPSGVSYMIENREIMKRTMPELFTRCRVLPVDNYTSNLRRMLASLSPVANPNICVLTPGVFNSAYFEHAFLAQEIGAELVEGRDLVVKDEQVFMQDVDGLIKVDVIYRRVDDDFIDPEVFNPESTLGVRGLMRAWKSGNVAIANAPGAGVADDKVVYSYVPEIIKYYLKEEPLLANVPTYRCEDQESLDYVLSNLEKLVVKPANESGGYGMLIGPQSTVEERAGITAQIQADPRNYIAQPTLSISTAPTLYDQSTDDGEITTLEMAARHVDLRPFVLQGDHLTVTTGGLTRVALVPGSLVVNSSQGGGSKDTWVVQTSSSTQLQEQRYDTAQPGLASGTVQMSQEQE